MADIFVSYARSDKARVAPLVAALEAQGWSVWWDPAIVPGEEFDSLIRQEINGAQAMLVVWTPASTASRWVRGEARIGADRGILVPVRFDRAELPIDAMAIHTTDLDDWKQDQTSRPFQELLQALVRHLKTAPRKTQDAERQTSICVLPFVNMSGDPEQEYFSDGLSEELLNQLAQLKGLKVAARTSSFALKGQNPDLKLVSEKLGVAHILEGSVRKAGNRLRITAQLIKASDGYHLWSNTFNRELDDVFQIQEDIARAVADALKITLGINESTLLPGGTKDGEAYDLYLRAQAWARQATADATHRAIALYRGAVTQDPRFAMAWLGLALSCVNAMILGTDIERWRRLGDEACEQAIACAPDAPMIHALRGTQLFIGKRDWIGAGKAFERASELAPSQLIAGVSDNSGVGFPFFVASVGRVAESADCYRIAVATDPLATMQMYQFACDCARRFDEAEADYKRAVALPINHDVTEYFALLRAMARESAQTVRERMKRYALIEGVTLKEFHEQLFARFDDGPALHALLRDELDAPSLVPVGAPQILAYTAAYFGDDALALACLRRAFVEMRQLNVCTIWHPLFATLRRTEEFKQLVRDLGIYDYWRASGKWGDFARPLGDDDFEIVK